MFGCGLYTGVSLIASSYGITAVVVLCDLYFSIKIIIRTHTDFLIRCDFLAVNSMIDECRSGTMNSGLVDEVRLAVFSRTHYHRHYAYLSTHSFILDRQQRFGKEVNFMRWQKS